MKKPAAERERQPASARARIDRTVDSCQSEAHPALKVPHRAPEGRGAAKFPIKDNPMIAEAAPIPASAAAPGSSMEPDAPATPNLDPLDYDSLWYKPLRLWGVTPQRLAYFGVRIVRLR